jgi:hypothetical protein
MTATPSDFETLVTGNWDHISATTRREGDGYVDTSGTIALRSHDALVGFYVYQYPKGHGCTGMFYTPGDGKLHRRMWRRVWARRTLYRLARQFLDDLGVERVR